MIIFDAAVSRRILYHQLIGLIPILHDMGCIARIRIRKHHRILGPHSPQTHGICVYLDPLPPKIGGGMQLKTGAHDVHGEPG